jgi:hypothetical protein
VVAAAALLLASAAAAGGARAAAAAHVDGISDQGLPAWDDSFAASAFAQAFRNGWAGGPDGVSLARYVVQWNALAEPGLGSDPNGDYRERLNAWLTDVRLLGLAPVLALTSYDGVTPRSPAQFAGALAEILALARADGVPIGYVEPWNEPNDQGRASPLAAARLADAAQAVCAGAGRCRVIAGDLLDDGGMVAYERAYERGLTFRPTLWGLHPYYAVAGHEDSTVLAFRENLPAGGAGAGLWFTEVGAMYCLHGVLRGEARQAADARYLLDALVRDPRVAPEHVFYYGFLAGDRARIPCARGGADSELYGAGDAPRAAAAVLGEGIASARALAFGPSPGAAPAPGAIFAGDG